MYGPYKPIKDRNDLLKRLSVLIIGIPIIYLLYLFEQKELNQTISEYEVIHGTIVDKGIQKMKYDEKYFIRIKSGSVTYKLEISKSITPNNFLRKLKVNKNSTAWVTRSLGNIELVQLKVENNFIIRHSNNEK